MGWDAFIYGPKGGRISNPEIISDFRTAIDEVLRHAEYHDIHINTTHRLIVLDVSNTGHMITKAGVDAWNAGKKLRVNDLKFNWDFKFEKEEAPYYWSARKAIGVCQKHNLTIEFSW